VIFFLLFYLNTGLFLGLPAGPPVTCDFFPAPNANFIYIPIVMVDDITKIRFQKFEERKQKRYVGS
jgi:hypothetical protein